MDCEALPLPGGVRKWEVMAASDEASEAERDPPGEEADKFGPRKRWLRVIGLIAVVAALLLAILWTQRERIADNVIGRELRARGIPATYTVTRIGARQQVLRDVVIGDPARPDLTVASATVEIRYPLGFPAIGRITLDQPRLFGSYRGGKLSFGALDPLLFTGSTEPFALPALDLAINDGRGLIETDFGPLGIKAQGAGKLDDGFAGVLAVAAPKLGNAGCAAEGASFYGSINVADGRPRFAGPLRLARLACAEQGLALNDAAVRLDAVLDKDAAGVDGSARLVSGAAAYGQSRAAALDAKTRFTWRNDTLAVRFDGGANRVATPALAFARLASEGTLRARDGFARIDYQGSLSGENIQPGAALDASLAAAQSGAEGTLLAPLLAQLRSAFAREAKGSRFAADLDFRRSADGYTLTMPQAGLTGASGAALLAVSRLSLRSENAGTPRIAGNFVTGGPGLPRIAGRIEGSSAGNSIMRLTMAEYRAGTSALALPRLTLAQGPDGSLGFVGELRASGPLPGGFARNLALPLDGRLGANGELAMLRQCTTLRFDQLTLANLTLEKRGLLLCPQRGAAILRYGAGGLRIAAGTPAIDLAGRLGRTPVRIASEPVGFAYPGVMTAQRLDIALGPAATASRFGITNLTANIGKEISGRFEGADVRLAATPLDITGASGKWRYAANRLTMSDAALTVTDREAPARFEPLSASGATLTLFANRIDAAATLANIETGREVTRVTIRHDLSTARGSADLAIEALTFDAGLQPDQISRLALGTIANARGVVRGTGRIDWTAAGATSRVISTGSFTTDNLDFAAAFGQVKVLSGTVNFTDLIGLVTAPDQEVRIAAINPGIEVTDGVVRFAIAPGRVLKLASATWPFLGGTLSLAPTDLRLGVSEARRYVLLIEGLDAARFVERMGLANLTATGTFDGQLPLVFSAPPSGDQLGAALGTVLGVGTPGGLAVAQDSPGSGRLIGGLLTSRPPGGNVSYVGELTYRDLSAIANFAFQTLRSLDYRTMTVSLDGALEGEIVTRVKFDGVRQGKGAKRNILTRAVANLPIQFNVNIRAPFYQLATSLKAIYDPAYVKDPREIGLIDAAGKAVTPAPSPKPTPSANPPIQPAESETVP